LKNLGQPEAAVTSLRRALELRPNSANAHCNLGSALKVLGQVDAAIASYRRALELNRHPALWPAF
jgi:Flp pilus assembly protein TadD